MKTGWKSRHCKRGERRWKRFSSICLYLKRFSAKVYLWILTKPIVGFLLLELYRLHEILVQERNIVEFGMPSERYYESPRRSFTSAFKRTISRITIAHTISSETESYPWLIRFLVSTIFRAFVIGKPGCNFKILWTASPIISKLRSTARFPFRSFWNATKLLFSGRKDSISSMARRTSSN